MSDIPLEEPIARPTLDIKWYELKSPKTPAGSAIINVWGMAGSTGEVDTRKRVDSVTVPISSLGDVDEDGNLRSPESAALFERVKSKLPLIVAERKAEIARQQAEAEESA